MLGCSAVVQDHTFDFAVTRMGSVRIVVVHILTLTSLGIGSASPTFPARRC